MTTVTYTDTFSAQSSLIEDVFYDTRTSELLVVLNGGNGYLYLDVPKSVYDDLADESSAGRYYNWYIKDNYNSIPLGHNWTLKRVDEPTAAKSQATTPKALTPTNNEAGAAKVYDLTAHPVATGTTHEVKFTVAGGDGSVKSYSLEARSVDEAVDELNKVGLALGLDFAVKSVTVHFED